MSEAIHPNTTIAHYSVISKIGAGGMGEVYLAQDKKLDQILLLLNTFVPKPEQET